MGLLQAHAVILYFYPPLDFGWIILVDKIVREPLDDFVTIDSGLKPEQSKGKDSSCEYYFIPGRNHADFPLFTNFFHSHLLIFIVILAGGH